MVGYEHLDLETFTRDTELLDGQTLVTLPLNGGWSSAVMTVTEADPAALARHQAAHRAETGRSSRRRMP